MTTRQRDLSEFNKPAPERSNTGSDTFIKLTGQRVPRYRRIKNHVNPKELRWLDDDVLTPMEESVYGSF